MSTDFHGAQLVRRLEAEVKLVEMRQSLKVLPPSKDAASTQEVWLSQFDDFYGFRGNNREVYLLSPWEVIMFWTCKRMKANAFAE